MCRTRKVMVYCMIAIGSARFIDAAHADTINLVGGWNLTWNIQADPTESPNVSIQAENAANSSDPVFNGYDLGLKFNLLSGSGSIALDSVSNPSSNSIVPAWLSSPPDGGAPFNTVENVALDKLDYPVPNAPTNLVTVDFEPGPNAPTLGAVFQVLSDYTLSDYVDHQGTPTSYANNATSDFVLGTITVVPEPTSIMLLGVAAMAFAINKARRQIRRSGTRVA